MKEVCEGEVPLGTGQDGVGGGSGGSGAAPGLEDGRVAVWIVLCGCPIELLFGTMTVFLRRWVLLLPFGHRQEDVVVQWGKKAQDEVVVGIKS